MKKNSLNKKKKLVFITATRADFGKIKSLAALLNGDIFFDVHIFATGMHMSEKHGHTVDEIVREGFPNIYQYINGAYNSGLDDILASTISGFGHYVKMIKPNLIVVHGDRSEAMAGALVGSLNNIPVAHIEGGEVSGTVDEHIRHSVSKLSHFHFVANKKAKKRLIQMGESKSNIFIIGSPDIDVMVSKDLPALEDVKKRYNIYFEKYGVVLFHPVTTEINSIMDQANIFADSLLSSGYNYVVIYPNNDPGSDVILEVYKQKMLNNPKFKIFPSIRFEHFLTLIKNAYFMIGNSSAGIREAPFYGVPSINIGSRQNGRLDGYKAPMVVDVDYNKDKILKIIKKFSNKFTRYHPSKKFGFGNSAERFLNICRQDKFWKIKIQKKFLDLN